MLLLRNTLTADVLVPKPLPEMVSVDFRTGDADIGNTADMVGAETVPNVNGRDPSSPL